jgi:hypothetical protein
MEVIVRPFKEDFQKLSKMGFTFLTFEERYTKWLSSSNKKKLGLCTPEVFSLGYDSLLSELKESIFVIVNTEEELNLVDSNFNIIEYN